MKYIFLLALKNILRYKRRTVLTFLILSFGIAFYLLMFGIVQGYKKQSIDNFIQFETGHIKIRSASYDKDDPYSISNYINNAEEVKAILKKKSFVKSFTERIQFLAEVDNGRDSSPCVVVGIDIENDPKVFTLTNYITEGNIFSGGALLGESLAKDLSLSIGDYIYITFRNEQGVIDSIELEVSGIIRSGDPMVNSSTVFITLEDAKRHLNTKKVTEIAILTDNLKKDKKYIKELQKELPDNQIKSWKELSESIEIAAKQDEVTTYIFVIFIAVIAIVGIINTMLMSIYEKVREIGTMKALGMTDGETQCIFLVEGLIFGVAGGIMGILLGSLFIWYFSITGYDVAAMMNKNGSGGMNISHFVRVIYPTWDIPSFFYAFIISVISSTLAAYYPAKKTTKLQAAECLRTIQ